MMALILIELTAKVERREQLEPLFEQVAGAVRQAGGEVIEVQVGEGLNPVYVVAEHDAVAAIETAVRATAAAVVDVAEVRLVGATLEQVKASRGSAEYLVEWDLPSTLTMETYLARKREKAPLYANVPEVRFLRTYVREDMGKCLCFYDAPDEAAVCRAREAVQTPFDRLTRLAGVPDAVR
jgi:hypothetical protein